MNHLPRHTMKKTDQTNDRFADSMIWIAIGLAFFFWIFKSLLQFFANSQGSFSAQLFGANIYDVYDRATVIVLFIVFGSHAQYNIKKRRKAELALRGSEDKYRSILESIEEGYYEVDTGFRLQFFNDSFHSIFNRPYHELFQADLREFLTKESAVLLRNTLEEVIRSGSPATTVECEFSGKSGGYRRIIELSASVITDSCQQATGFRGIIRDVTEKRMLERKVIESLKDVKEARTGAILGLAKLAEHRDSDTGQHLERIRDFVKILAEEIAKQDKYQGYVSPEYIEDLYHSSILHDIGKVGIPDSILLKPGRLTTEEFEIMKQHVILGGETLAAVDAHMKGNSFLTIGKEIAYHHHEKWDGSGYPSGLAGDEIPLSARLVALADVYDALTSKRCYKEAFSHEKAKEIIVEERGRAFDPVLVDAFLAHEQEFKRIRTTMHG